MCFLHCCSILLVAFACLHLKEKDIFFARRATHAQISINVVLTLGYQELAPSPDELVALLSLLWRIEIRISL